MINHFTPEKNWQDELNNLITDIDELLERLQLSHIKPQLYLPKTFCLRVPRAFVAKMQVGNVQDPLLLQVLPQAQELHQVAGFVVDPLQEGDANPVAGLLHKYPSRVLITTTGACAIHCRYCFRQHYDYQRNLPKSTIWQGILAYIKQHPDVNEVIFSGGDPLTLSNRRLFALWQDLEALPQITTIRIHSRLPVVVPSRLDDELCQRMQHSRCQFLLVLHCNHANEIDEQTAYYIGRLRQTSVTLYNQAVLLAGINDTVEAQCNLWQTLFGMGVLPYYLHVLDKVAGSAHFYVTNAQAIDLYWQMLSAMSGYLLPKLVAEIPDKQHKMPLNLF